MNRPNRSDVWLVDLNPVEGHEQGEKRPALVLSIDAFNHGPSELASVVPITKTRRPIPIHVHVMKGQGGLTMDSSILCDQLRCVSLHRLIKRYGTMDEDVVREVEEKVKIVLGLD